MPGYALEDGAAAHFIGGELHRAVIARPNAKAYRVRVVNGTVEEESLGNYG